MAKKKKQRSLGSKTTILQLIIIGLLLLGAVITVVVAQQQTSTNSKAFEPQYQTAQQAGRTTPGRGGMATPTLPPMTGTSLLSTPTGLTVTAVTNTRVQLRWQSVSGANMYRIYRNATYIGQATAGLGSSGPIPTTIYEDALVNCGSSYEYQVSAVTATTGMSEAVLANSQSPLSAKAAIATGACTAGQAGPPVCTGIEGPSQLPQNTLGTFTFTYSGHVNAVQWSTTGQTYTADDFFHPNGTLYPPNQLTIKWKGTPGTYQLSGYVYDGNFVKSQCPPKTVTIL